MESKAAVESVKRSAGHEPALRALDLVVVEDDPEYREALLAVLERKGHLVRTCGSVGEAIGLVRNRRPDAILTDLELSEESGSDLATQLRSQPGTASIAHIAMSGHVDPDWGLVRNFDLYLRKPFAPARLIDLLEQLAASAGFAERVQA